MLPVVACIDDDSLVHMLTEIILQDTQFCKKFIGFDNGKLGLDYIQNQLQLPIEQQQIPTLIFLDINMPVVDGWDFLDLFQENFSHLTNQVKIIVLSSSVDPKDKQRALDNPIVLNFLNKPLSIESIELLKSQPFFSSYFTK